MASPTDIRAGRAFVEITTRNTGLEKGLKSAQTRLRAFGQGLQSIGTKVLSGGLLAGAPLAISAQTFATFEQQMARVRALTAAVGPEYQKLEDRAKELGRTTVFSASQAAEAMSAFALAGFDVEQILKAIGPTLDLAATGQLEIGQAADIAAKIMAGMGLEADQLGHAVDVMAKAMTTANTDLEMLGDAMKFVGPIAKSAGRSLEETVAVIQALSNAGIQAEMAGTTLRGILLSLTSPSSEAEKELKRLGVQIVDAQGNVRPLANIIDDLNAALKGLGTGQKLNILGKIFPARQAAGAAELLSQGGDQIRKFQDALEQSGGTAARIAGVQLNTLSGDVTILKSALEGVGIAIGESFSQPLRGSIKLITGFIGTLGRWIAANRGIVTAIAVTVAAVIAIGGALIAAGVGAQVLAFAFGGLATVVGTIAGLVGAVLSPLGLLIAAVATLGTVIVTYTGAGGDALDWLGQRFIKLRNFATAAFGGITDALAAGDTELAARILWLSLKAIWQQGVGALEKLWTQFQGDSLSLWEETTSGIAIMLTDTWSGLQSFWEDVTFGMAQAWEQFTALVVIFWNRASALVQKGLVHLRSLFDDSVNVEAEIKKIDEISLAAQRGSFDEAEAAIKARQQERDSAKQAIEQERRARQDALAESLKATLKAQQTETDSALASTEAEIAAARKELDDLIAEAKRKRELTDAGLATNKPGELPRVPKIPTADELANLADQKLSVTGTFNAAVAERLGTQGNEPVVRVLEEVRELNRQILGEARDGGIVFA